jgi:hypothetical protein
MDIKITGLDDLQRKLDGIAKAGDPQEIARRMRATRCPVHGKGPTNVRVVGDEVKGDFCCARARDLASKAVQDGITRAMR